MDYKRHLLFYLNLSGGLIRKEVLRKKYENFEKAVQGFNPFEKSLFLACVCGITFDKFDPNFVEMIKDILLIIHQE